MRTTSVSKLKAALSEYIRLVRQGEEVIVTDRGVPVARVTAIDPALIEDERTCRLIARGAMSPGKPVSLKDIFGELPVVSLPEGTAQRIIDEERGE